MQKGFYKKNIHDLQKACERALREGKDVLVIFTIKALLSDMLPYFDGPLDVDKANILTKGLQQEIVKILTSEDPVTAETLGGLVLLYYLNKKRFSA